jgi:hypothetical protein
MLPQDTILHSISTLDGYIKASPIKKIYDKPELAIFNKRCYDDYCEIFLGDEKYAVDIKDIYLPKG